MYYSRYIFGMSVGPRINLVGKKVGKLTVLAPAGQRGRNCDYFWLCQCECGNTKVVRGAMLQRSQYPIRSCGCLRNKLVDHTGKRFGKLTVTSFAGYHPSHYKIALWNCLCDCGKTVVIMASNLTRGNSTSCGCSRLLDMQGEGNKRQIIRRYRRTSEKAGRPWLLSDSDAVELFKSNCHYCGTPPSCKRDVSGPIAYWFNGIDRIDNRLGYIQGNVVACCKDCNFAKGSRSYDSFIEWARRLGRHLLERS